MNENVTELCELAYKYGTDKCPQIKHNYTPFYYGLLESRRFWIKKILEIGVGNINDMQHVSKLKGSYQPGASLYMWRDFFPNAQVYGADIDPDVVFEDERIKTYLCDAQKSEDLENLIRQIGADIDIVIDDASHRVQDQVFTCLALMPMLGREVIYIIEDVRQANELLGALCKYECEVAPIPRAWRDDRVVVVRKGI